MIFWISVIIPRSQNIILKQFSAQRRKANKWCEALSSISPPSGARRAKSKVLSFRMALPGVSSISNGILLRRTQHHNLSLPYEMRPAREQGQSSKLHSKVSVANRKCWFQGFPKFMIFWISVIISRSQNIILKQFSAQRRKANIPLRSGLAGRVRPSLRALLLLAAVPVHVTTHLTC